MTKTEDQAPFVVGAEAEFLKRGRRRLVLIPVGIVLAENLADAHEKAANRFPHYLVWTEEWGRVSPTARLRALKADRGEP